MQRNQLGKRQQGTLDRRLAVVRAAKADGLTPERLLQRYTAEPTDALRNELWRTYDNSDALYILLDTWGIPHLQPTRIKMGARGLKGLPPVSKAATPEAVFATTERARALIAARKMKLSKGWRTTKRPPVTSQSPSRRRWALPSLPSDSVPLRVAALAAAGGVGAAVTVLLG